MKDPFDLKTINDLIKYLQACILLEGEEPKSRIASRIVGIRCNVNWDEWNDEKKYPELFELADIAWDMEVPELHVYREADWQHLKKLVHQFAERIDSQGSTS